MENTWKLRVEGGPLSIYIYMYMSDAAVIADSNSLIKYRWSGLRENLQ